MTYRRNNMIANFTAIATVIAKKLAKKQKQKNKKGRIPMPPPTKQFKAKKGTGYNRKLEKGRMGEELKETLETLLNVNRF